MADPIRLNEATDADAAYILGKIKEAEGHAIAADLAIKDQADASVRYKSHVAANREARKEAGARLIAVHNVRSKKSNAPDGGASGALRGTWRSWLEQNGIGETTSRTLMAEAGWTEEQSQEQRDKDAERKRKERDEAKRENTLPVLERMNGGVALPKMNFSRLSKNERALIEAERERLLGEPWPDKLVYNSELAHRCLDVARQIEVLFTKHQKQETEPEEKKFTETQQAKFDRLLKKAVLEEAARLRDEFEATVKKRVDDRVKELRAHLTEAKAKAEEEGVRLNATRARINAIMSYEEFKLIRGCLHPDRLTSVDPDRLNKAYLLFSSLEANIDPNIPISVLREQGWSHVRTGKR